MPSPRTVIRNGVPFTPPTLTAADLDYQSTDEHQVCDECDGRGTTRSGIDECRPCLGTGLVQATD